MKFRVVLIIAFLLTAALLYTNAVQMFSFEKSSGSASHVDTSNSALKSYAATTILGPERYGQAMALTVSSARASSILTSSLPESSCVQAFERFEDNFASKPFIDINSDSQLIPASTNKLITAAVVLTTMDPASTLDTSLLSAKKGATLSKAYVRTSGDPTFVTDVTPPARRPDYLSPANVRTFADFAAKTYAAGVRSISRLVIDNTWFELDSVEPGWSDDKEQVGLLAALNADEGFEGTALAADANDHGAAVLKAAFAAKGISIGAISFGAIPNTLGNDSVIATTSSASINELVADILKTSNNVFAEQLLAAAVHKKSGKVTERSRADFVASSLAALKIDTSDYVFDNGSGYSKNARATCELKNQVVEKMLTLGIDLAELSSFAGKDGTLAKRFTNIEEEVHAKTGTLDNVTALSGSLGNDISFSFIANSSFSEDGGKALQDQLVSTLSQFPFVVEPQFPATFGG